jgi:hypothetical protein
VNPDRLFNLLPVVHREHDDARGHLLRALLAVIGEQVDVVEEDIERLYRNWFIETCDDWVVPYIGDLIGYRAVHDAGEPGDPGAARAAARNRILIPRREIASTIAYRRRKGTVALLEEIGNQVTSWPARVVECYRLLGWMQHLDHVHVHRGQTLDVRRGSILDGAGGPFEQIAHTVDVRRANSHRTTGRFNIPDIALFVWRLHAYSVSRTNAEASDWKSPAGWTLANCIEDEAPNYYTFSVLGNTTPLFNRPRPEESPTDIAGAINVPAPIRRRALDTPAHRASTELYGPRASLAVWAPGWPAKTAPQPIPAEAVIPADLSQWHYDPPRNHIAVDPETGRMAFPSMQLPRQGVLVYYHYGFSADIGGGEYARTLSQPVGARIYRVGDGAPHKRIREALDAWQHDTSAPRSAVIEIVDSGVYTEPLDVSMKTGTVLQIRAASGVRPVIRLLDYLADRPDGLSIRGAAGSRVTLDGLLIVGRGLNVSGNEVETGTAGPDLCQITIRHCTLVPGWALLPDCEPRRPTEPSVQLMGTTANLIVEHSIIGGIEVVASQANREPTSIQVSDSIWDATSGTRAALAGSDDATAFVRLTVARSTVIGVVRAHEIALAENSIFTSDVVVSRLQTGCVRFCYVPPKSQTPRRFECQPDLVTATLIGPAKHQAEARVRPRFDSVRFGTPTYGRLAEGCAEEITRGADDESEMGAFHDLYAPQRAANLRARLDDYTVAGMDAGIIYAT